MNKIEIHLRIAFLTFALVMSVTASVTAIAKSLRTNIQDVQESFPTEYYVVYTEPDKPSELRTRVLPLYELTLERYETLARMVAGKVGNRSQTCQQMVANVIYNELLDCGKDLDRAAELYDLYDYADPTEDTYAAVDAIFERGEWMLDEDVLWFGDADNPSDFHKTLVFDCECDGIAFYKAYRPAIVPGGAVE